jgi:hypothetical protein
MKNQERMKERKGGTEDKNNTVKGNGGQRKGRRERRQRNDII